MKLFQTLHHVLPALIGTFAKIICNFTVPTSTKMDQYFTEHMHTHLDTPRHKKSVTNPTHFVVILDQAQVSLTFFHRISQNIL